MISNEIRDRLQSSLSGLGSDPIRIAATLDEILEFKEAFPPSIFVQAPDLSSSESYILAGAQQQRIFHNYSIAILCRNLLDERGANALDQIKLFHDGIISSLMGWSPDSNKYDPLEFISAGPYSLDGYQGIWLWIMKFKSSEYYRK